MAKTLFDQVKIGDLTLNNRIIMAPLTRMRSRQPGDIPHQLNATYYSQRSSAGLIISEATQISPQGKGYPATPGIYSDQQIEGWKLVTNAVRNAGGKIFLQLWHVGRISHKSLQIDNKLPVAPSAIPAKNSGTFDSNWQPVAIETPHALTIEEIKSIVKDYKIATQNAIKAGFDGVELHGANGYLVDQFLQDSSNHRQDIYGGTIENRSRFLFEVLDEIIKIIGKGRVGVRLSPFGTFNDMSDSDPIKLFSYILSELNNRNIAFVDLIEPRASSAGGSDNQISNAPSTSEIFRQKYDGFLISAGGYNAKNAPETIANDKADAIAFGRYFISNPDLVDRLKNGVELAKYDRTTFYGGAEKGYTDYPFYK
ncbi:MAG: alkene reductase [Proteobacteria bacterium]|nr:alkene reductase [Pseudomonadota bacterium]NCA28200.1 alkene reductase [Pseudomonadota bacterium]